MGRARQHWHSGFPLEDANFDRLPSSVMYGVLNGEGVARVQAKAAVHVGGESGPRHTSIMFSIINKSGRYVYDSKH